MKGFMVAAAVMGLSASAALAETPQERLQDAANVVKEIMSTPDNTIPQNLLADAHCVVVVPGLKKGAFIVGGEFGRGFAECRSQNGNGWDAPAAVRIEGGSVGFQIGGSSTDLVMLIMGKNGMNKLMQDKFTIGADASAAAGPVGRTANAMTDAQMHAEILSWSRARGVFAGISLKGATLRPDDDANALLYHSGITNKQIIGGSMQPPAAAQPLISELNRYSMRQEGPSNADRSKNPDKK